jgi:hypothetical protein
MAGASDLDRICLVFVEAQRLSLPRAIHSLPCAVLTCDTLILPHALPPSLVGNMAPEIDPKDPIPS